MADAGANQTAVQHEEVTLSAAESSDVDGTIEAYAWAQTGGPDVTLSDPGAVHPTFTAPPTSEQIELTFELSVTDDMEDSSTDSTIVRILPNEPPQLAIAHPCAGCRTWGDTVTVAGVATPGPDVPEVVDRDAVTVEVDAGVRAVPATMIDGGFWIAANVPVDPMLNQVSVTVTATDAFGVHTQAELNLEQLPTLTQASIAVDPEHANRTYLLETAHPQERIVEIDVASGAVMPVHEVQRELTSSRGGPILVDSARQWLLWQDSLADSIIATDINTGSTTILSGNGVGDGPSFSQIAGMALDRPNQRVLVSDRALNAVLAVELDSGDRSILTDNTGTGPALDEPGVVTVDAVTGDVYVAQFPGEILVLQPGTGNRMSLTTSEPLPDTISSLQFDAARSKLVVFSEFLDLLITVDPLTGAVSQTSPADTSGISIAAGRAAIDVEADRYLVGDFGQRHATEDTDALIDIDPETGARQFVYRDTLGSGPGIVDSRSVGVDPWWNLVYVLDRSSLLSVEVDGGTRTLVSGPSRGAGQTFDQAIDLALDLDHDLAYVLAHDSGSANVLAVDLDTGDRQLISGPLRGSGPELLHATAVVLDQTRSRLLVTDDALDAVVTIDLISGDRMVFSGPTGMDPLVTPLGMEIDPDDDRLIVTDEGNGGTPDYRIFGIDLETGLRTVLDEPGVGPDFTRHLMDVAVIPDTNLVVVATDDSLTVIDLDSGARAVLASTTTGAGENVIDIRKLAVDPFRGVVYAWSHRFEALFQFVAFNGDRVVVSKSR